MAKKINAVEKMSYEDALAELENILAKMEDGTQKLEDMLLQFERGKLLLVHCQKLLEDAELKVRSLEEQGKTE